MEKTKKQTAVKSSKDLSNVKGTKASSKVDDDYKDKKDTSVNKSTLKSSKPTADKNAKNEQKVSPTNESKNLTNSSLYRGQT